MIAHDVGLRAQRDRAVGACCVRDPGLPESRLAGLQARWLTLTRRMMAVSAVLPGNVQHRIGTPSAVTVKYRV